MQDNLVLANEVELAEFRETLIQWFRENGREFPWRNSTASNYQKIIAEIFLQRTKATTVNKFYQDFIRDFPSWRCIAGTEITKLSEYLKPLGLWNRRALSIHNLSIEMLKNGEMFPDNRMELEKLPGVGQYIANAILLLVFDKPEPLLDVNMARVLERYFGPRKLVDIRKDSYLQDLSRLIIKSTNPKVINFSILDFSALVCKITKPLCEICPLQRGCKFFLSKDTSPK